MLDFRAFFESAPGLYLVLTADSNFIIEAVTNAYVRATMTEREKILGRGLFEVFPDNPADEGATGTRNLRTSLERVLKSRKPDAMAVQKYDIQRPETEGGGFEVRYWSPVNTPVLNANGEVTNIIHQVEDVTEFVRMKLQGAEQAKITEELKNKTVQMEVEIFARAQQLQRANEELRITHEDLSRANDLLEYKVEERTKALKASELQLRLITNALPALISYIDRDKRYRLVNASYEEWFRQPLGDIPGKTMSEVIGEPAYLVVSPYVESVLQGNTVHFEQETPYRGIGTRHVQGIYVPDFDPNGEVRGFVVLITDISEQKRIERELKEALRTRDEFLSIASHELKTPLTSLSLQLQMLSRQFQRASASGSNGDIGSILPTTLNYEKLVRSISVCENQSRKLANLLEELLDLTRIRLGHMPLTLVEVDLVDIAEEVVEQLANEAKAKGILISLHAEKTVRGVWDKTRIEQVVANLLTNAIKYGQGRPVAVAIAQSATSGRARLKVTDQGMGVPSNLQERIFERFERAISSKNISGLGLGLYITRQIVEAHGGTITVESELGQGSTFTVELPLQPKPI